MKRLFFAVVALSMLATSCAKDEAAAPEATGKTKTVTFTVKAPEMNTRYGDGTAATVLYYAFYDETGAILPAYTNVIEPDPMPEEGWLPGNLWSGLSGKIYNDDNEEIEIKVTLVEDRTYSAIFWAQSEEMDNYYVPDLKDSKTVTFDFSNRLGNPNHYDAFYAYIDGISTTTPKNTVTLKRPFAELNIGVPYTDIQAGEAAGVYVQSVAVEVKAPTKLDLVSGAVSEEETILLGWDEDDSVAYTYNSTQYIILATNYILVGKDASDKKLETVNFLMSELAVADETHSDAITRTFEAVPIQRNYRTYILGNIITSSDAATVYTVKIDPAFTTPDKTVNATDTTGDSTGDTN